MVDVIPVFLPLVDPDLAQVLNFLFGGLSSQLADTVIFWLEN
jgi:hypothetical protein